MSGSNLTLPSDETEATARERMAVEAERRGTWHGAQAVTCHPNMRDAHLRRSLEQFTRAASLRAKALVKP